MKWMPNTTTNHSQNDGFRIRNFGLERWVRCRHRRMSKAVQRLSVSYPPPPSPPVETREWNTVETRTFVWDGNNLVLEKIACADGTAHICEYFWGMDKSGTEQGAGGVEGLLAVSMDGVFYIPCYDHNGNIVRYVSETGGIAAQYVYDPYGNVVESCGSLADAFSFGFSTKCHDRETGVVGYQRRFYRPDLGRWLNRDPIEEDGGENLYVFCKNTPISKVDPLGVLECCTCTYGGNLLRHGESIGSSVIANQTCFYLSEGGVIEVLTRYSCVPRLWESVGDCFNKFCLVKKRYRCKRISRGDVEPINAAYVWVFLSSEVKPCTR